MLSSGQMRSAGSPPPMRGKGISGVRFPEAKRITPAYAGKSAPLFCCGFGFWDHPRLCGEKGGCSLQRVLLPGSPPPMRGKVCLLLSGFSCSGITPAYAGKSPRIKEWDTENQVLGITPAYAGKSRLEYAVFPFVKDHPRLCGEKAYFNWFVPVAQGSPPPMRGKGLAIFKNQWY